MIDDFRPSVKRQTEKQTSLDQVPDQNPVQQPPAEQDVQQAQSHTSPKVDFDIDELAIDGDKASSATDPEAEGNDGSKETASLAKKSWKKRMKLSWPPGKKEWVTSAAIIIVCGVIVAFVLNHTGSKPVAEAAKIPDKTIAVAPATVPSSLSGLPVSPEVNKTPVTGVMIENSDGARPQAGLSNAGVVFEAVAEGGITRFLALYQDQAPANVGPIRSARPYYLQWALGFDASLAHVGGSADALNDIKAWGVKDLNEMYNAGSYHRISTRQAPHNVYTSISTLNQLETAKGYTSTSFTGFPRKTEDPSKAPTVKSIDMNPSWSDYSVHYDYDSATNSYNRSEAGSSMVDSNTAKQLSPKVVIGMIIPKSQGALDSTGAYYTVYQVVGNGQAYVFQDGTLTTGTWSKSSASSQIQFTDATGKTIKLDPGQTWITALGTSNLLTYSD